MRKGLLTLLFGILCCLCLQNRSVHAAGSLSISPLRLQLELKPGQTTTAPITVTNKAPEPITVHLSAESFSVTNEQYDYNFNQAAALGKWISFKTNDFALQPNETQTISYSIGVPETAEPGGKYIAIFASTTASQSHDVTTIERAGQLVYLTVSGKVSKKGQVIDFQLPRLSTQSSLPWSLRLNNIGNTHFDSRLTITLGAAIGRTQQIVQENHLILPSSIRAINGTIPVSSLPGLYKLHFLVGQGDNPSYKSTRWVVYTPWWSLLIVGVLILLVTWLFLRHRRRH